MEIPTAGYDMVLVSHEDYETVSKLNVFIHQKYPRINIEGFQHTLHRFIMSRYSGTIPDNMVVDHINGNKLDARRENLRIVTPSQNAHNKKCEPPKSGFRGVTKTTSGDKWQVMFGKICIGRYDTPEQGARAYDKYVTKFVDKDGHTNFEYSEDEKSDIINSDFELYKPIVKNPDMFGITETKSNTFIVRIGKTCVGTFKTLEEAKVVRNEAHEKHVTEKEKKRLNEPVTMNENGDAIISLSGTRGKGKFTIVDVDKWHDLMRYSWSLDSSGYTRSSQGQLHTYITKNWDRPKRVLVIDHIDQNKLNNKLSNLRIATRSENAKNVTNRATKKPVTQRPKKVRKYMEDVNLPLYVSRLVTSKGDRKGYIVRAHDGVTQRSFVNPNFPMEENLEKALEYLRTAHS
jgi:hypothetical protein